MKLIFAMISLLSSPAMAFTTEVECRQKGIDHGYGVRISTFSPSDWLAHADIDKDTGLGFIKLGPRHQVYRGHFPGVGDTIKYVGASGYFFELTVMATQASANHVYGEGTLKADLLVGGDAITRIDVPMSCELIKNEVIFED